MAFEESRADISNIPVPWILLLKTRPCLHLEYTTYSCMTLYCDLHRHLSDSRESCIMLQSGLTRSLLAKFLQHSVVACSTQILCCRGTMLQMRSRIDLCEPLMPDVVAPKAHQSNRSYVNLVDLPLDSLCKVFAWWAVALSKSGVGACTGMGACPGQYGRPKILSWYAINLALA